MTPSPSTHPGTGGAPAQGSTAASHPLSDSIIDRFDKLEAKLSDHDKAILDHITWTQKRVRGVEEDMKEYRKDVQALSHQLREVHSVIVGHQRDSLQVERDLSALKVEMASLARDEARGVTRGAHLQWGGIIFVINAVFAAVMEYFVRGAR